MNILGQIENIKSSYLDRNKILNQKIDNRGKIISFFDCKVENLHAGSINPGAKRGNHKHEYDEILCIHGGKNICEIFLGDDEGKSFNRKIFVKEDVFATKIPKGTKHEVINKGDNKFYLVSFLIKK